MVTDLSDISRILTGNGDVKGLNRTVTRLLTDSRSLSEPSATLFFAIVTPTGDGHAFIPELYSKGVRSFVVKKGRVSDEMRFSMPEAVLIETDDTLAALQKIGALGGSNATRRVAITGSRGKTTLKEWLFQLLAPLRKISRSPRSFNSRIGVPLSLWEIQPQTDIAIIEAGISRKGEMGVLRDMIAPDTVIITNVGTAHSEGFGGMQEKADEKMSLAEGAGRVIYPADNVRLRRSAEKLALKHPETEFISWTQKDGDSPLKIRIAGNGKLGYDFNGRQGAIAIPSGSAADIENAANTLAFMLSEGFGDEEIAERFRCLHPVGTRLNVVEGMNGCSLIEDSYTSDFSSLDPALDFMRRRASGGQSLTVIVSDPDNEGGDSEVEFGVLAEMLRNRGISRVICIGPNLKRHSALFGFARETRFFDNTGEMTAEMSAADFINEMILLKGAPQFRIGEISRMLEARTHETVLEVSLDGVIENYNTFRGRLPQGTGLVCMVKASAYGAGSTEIASVLQDCGAAYLAVAVLDEGIELRRHGITMPVMVMNPRVPSYASMFEYRLEPEIYSPAMLEDVIREAEKRGIEDYPIHIKLDTGMHRTGFVEEELPALMERIRSQRNVTIQSVFSHLATADCPDMDEYTLGQLACFERLTEYMLSESPVPFLRHILNTAGILRFPQYHYDMARLGIGLYGARILPPEIQPAPAVVSTLRTVVINVRDYEAGEAIGYGRKGILTSPARIVTIPIGYADGMNRRFGNGAIKVRINGHECPTIGNICMDACMIDATGIDVKPGDPVEIFGTSMPVESLAEAIGTIPYEILTSVSPRVKRIYSRG